MTEKDKIGSSEKWTYAYNNKEHLVQAKHYNSSSVVVLQADYKYDVFNNRSEKPVDSDGAGILPATITRYTFDGWNPAKPSPVGTDQ